MNRQRCHAISRFIPQLIRLYSHQLPRLPRQLIRNRQLLADLRQIHPLPCVIGLAAYMVFLTPFFDCHSAGSADLYLLAPFRQFRRVLHCPYVHVHLRLSMRFSGILQDSPRLFEILRVSLRTIPIFSLRSVIAYTGCYWALTVFKLFHVVEVTGFEPATFWSRKMHD